MAEIHQRLREVRVSGPMAGWFCSLLLGVPFAVAWAMDDGSWNQPFPRGLRKLVVAAAALHLGATAWRLIKAVRTWEPLAPILHRLAAGYVLLGITIAAGLAMEYYGVGLLAHFTLTVPAGWAFYLLGTAMAEPASRATPGGAMTRVAPKRRLRVEPLI